MLIQNFIYGLIIGLGFIIPGVSGGVIATILGIYETIINKILTFFKDIKNNSLYLIPLIIGIILSVLFFSKIILYLLNNKLFFISYVFIGLILGSIPTLINEIKKKEHKTISLPFFIISFTLGIILYLLENNIEEVSLIPSNFRMALAGIIYAIGKIIPGISGASLLMFLGVYKYFLNVIANPFNLNINIILSFIPFIITFIISAIILLKLINYLFNHYHYYTYSAIIGFVISSIIFIYPHNFNILSIIITLLSFTISYYLSK